MGIFRTVLINTSMSMLLLSFYLFMVSELQSSYLSMVLGPDQEGSGVAGGGVGGEMGRREIGDNHCGFAF